MVEHIDDRGGVGPVEVNKPRPTLCYQYKYGTGTKNLPLVRLRFQHLNTNIRLYLTPSRYTVRYTSLPISIAYTVL